MSEKFEDCKDCAHRRKPIDRRQFICNRCEGGEQFEDIEQEAMDIARDFQFIDMPNEWSDEFQD